jgi:hypothetical protein
MPSPCHSAACSDRSDLLVCFSWASLSLLYPDWLLDIDIEVWSKCSIDVAKNGYIECKTGILKNSENSLILVNKGTCSFVEENVSHLYGKPKGPFKSIAKVKFA